MKYKVLLFDVDETLFDFKMSEDYAFRQTLGDFNINYDTELCISKYKEINSKLWADLEKGLINSEDLKIERFKRLFSEIKVDMDPLLFSNTYLWYLGSKSFTYPEAEEIIARLSERYTLVIVTNGLKEVQRKRIEKSRMGKYFQEIVVSEEVKATKPNSKIFNYALRSIGFRDKSKVLMIGDSLTSDIAGGFNSKIDTCWYNPHRLKNKTEINPTYEINTLLSLYEILL